MRTLTTVKIHFFVFLIRIFAFSQEKYLKNDFIAPLDISLHMSGTFGELRGNHFHSGIDFKIIENIFSH